MADSFKFELVAPEKLLLSEEADEVVVPGNEGEFTVMGNHAPFMTTLKPGLVTAKLSGGEEKKLFVRGGFADVGEEGLILLAEYAEPADNMSASDLDHHIEEATQRMENAEHDDERHKAEQYLQQLTHVKSIFPA